jgi:hypothetical protein
MARRERRSAPAAPDDTEEVVGSRSCILTRTSRRKPVWVLVLEKLFYALR